MQSRSRTELEAILPVPDMGVGVDLIVATANCHVTDVTYVGGVTSVIKLSTVHEVIFTAKSAKTPKVYS